MRILIERKTNSGKKSFVKVDSVEKIVIFEGDKAVKQINKDFSECKPKKNNETN